MKGRSIAELESAGRAIGEYAYEHHITTRGYRDDIRARARELGFTYAVSGDVNTVVESAASIKLGELLDAAVTR